MTILATLFWSFLNLGLGLSGFLGWWQVVFLGGGKWFSWSMGYILYNTLPIMKKLSYPELLMILCIAFITLVTWWFIFSLFLSHFTRLHSIHNQSNQTISLWQLESILLFIGSKHLQRNMLLSKLWCRRIKKLTGRCWSIRNCQEEMLLSIDKLEETEVSSPIILLLPALWKIMSAQFADVHVSSQRKC